MDNKTPTRETKATRQAKFPKLPFSKSLHGHCAKCKRDRWLTVCDLCRECHNAEQTKAAQAYYFYHESLSIP